MTIPRERLAANLAQLRQEIAGRARLIAVTKTHSAEDIRTLFELGVRDFGENRVQELLEKDQELGDLAELRWHLIGPLQSNKINKLRPLKRLFAIHSVDSQELIGKLSQGPWATPELNIFLQVNTSGEAEKGGLESEAELSSCAQALRAAPAPLRLRGLMTMGRIRTDNVAGEARRSFTALQALKTQLDEHLGGEGLELSMGMSGDYLIAISFGAHWVRVGSKIFSELDPR